MKVKVTRKHIKAGVTDSPTACAIAQSLRETTGLDPGSVYVSEDYCRFGEFPNAIYYRLSRPAQRFIQDFDSGKKVKPATFVLRAIRPGESI